MGRYPEVAACNKCAPGHVRVGRPASATGMSRRKKAARPSTSTTVRRVASQSATAKRSRVTVPSVKRAVATKKRTTSRVKGRGPCKFCGHRKAPQDCDH